MIYLRLADLGDAQFLLECRNDNSTRECSHNSEKIKYDSHIQWLTKTLASTSRKLYVAEMKGNPVGTARVDLHVDDGKNIAELSWIVSPKYRGNGICKPMMKKVVKAIDQDILIYAEIKKDNLGSIKIAEYLGMVLTKENSGILCFSGNSVNLS